MNLDQNLRAKKSHAQKGGKRRMKKYTSRATEY